MQTCRHAMQSKHHRTTHQASLACFVSGQAQHGFNFFLSSSVCFLLESVVVAADGMFKQITGTVEVVEEPRGQRWHEETRRTRCVLDNQTRFWFWFSSRASAVFLLLSLASEREAVLNYGSCLDRSFLIKETLFLHHKSCNS